jgi:transcriptional regulator with XRE-family HTH domain
MEEQTIKQNFARNLLAYRKSRHLTQSQLAEKLNYSDKSISKWECGDVLPDIVTISMIAEFFGITIDQLIGSKIPQKEVAKDRHVLVTLMSCGLPFLIAGIAFVILLAFKIPNAWMLFIYALPVSFIVAIVFCAMWFRLLGPLRRYHSWCGRQDCARTCPYWYLLATLTCGLSLSFA